MNYNPLLTQFVSADGLKLPGLLYEPEHESDRVALYLHGNGSSSIFYSARTMNAVAERLNGAGIAFFPFNNRGAHFIKTLKKGQSNSEERVQMGMTYELIRDCVPDIDGAIAYLSELGYRRFYLIGLSTGANKICVYDKYAADNRVEKYVLLSGGDDMGLYYSMMGKDLFEKALVESQRMIAEGNGTRLVPDSYTGFPLSYQSLYDTINPEGDYNIFPFLDIMKDLRLSRKVPFAEYASMTRPTLVVYGSEDEYCYGDVARCVSILKNHSRGKDNFSYKVFPGVDHSFTAAEGKLAEMLAHFLM